MGVRLLHIVLNMERANVAAEQTKLLVLRHFLHIRVSRIPDGVEKGMIDHLDLTEQIGGVIDPIKSLVMHLVEVFYKDVDAPLLRLAKDGHKEELILRKCLLGS